MPTVSYFRVVGCEHVAAKEVDRNEGTEYVIEVARKAYEGPPIQQ